MPASWLDAAQFLTRALACGKLTVRSAANWQMTF
jgi:hypothetical protein